MDWKNIRDPSMKFAVLRAGPAWSTYPDTSFTISLTKAVRLLK